jgi:hypothetical protein
MAEICALLRYYAALNGSSAPTFRDNLSVPSSRVKKSVQNYHSTLRNTPAERRYRLHRGGILKARVNFGCGANIKAVVGCIK